MNPYLHDIYFPPLLENALDAWIKQKDSTHWRFHSLLNQEKISHLRVLLSDDSYDASIADYAMHLRTHYSSVIVVGMGGSTLNGQALTGVSHSLTPEKTDSFSLLFMDTIDASSLEEVSKKIAWDKTHFLIISKSGKTLETLVQTSFLYQEYCKRFSSASWGKHCTIITDPSPTPLRIMGEKHKAVLWDHPSIGGRFAGLTSVGLLPAALTGKNIKEIRDGAKWVWNHPESFIEGAAFHIFFKRRNIHCSVYMPYFDQWEGFSHWQAQIWAESLGKNGQGLTPLLAKGTLDQHSQLQLYLEGPKDKSFTFISLNEKNASPVIDLSSLFETVNIAASLEKFTDIQKQSTIKALLNSGSPVRQFSLPSLQEKTLGAMMMHAICETYLIADAFDIDPEGQNSVEAQKKIAHLLF